MFTFSIQAEVQSLESKMWRRARPLPAGQQLWSAQTAYRKSTQRFSNQGKLQPLGARYARATTWQHLLDSESSASVKAEISQHMRDHNLSPNDVAAVSQYEVQREEAILQLDWAYGLTSKWMVGLEFPLVWSTTQVTNHVALTPSLSSLVGAQRARHLSSDLRESVKKAADRELSNSGYDSVPDQKQVFEAGDINLLNQLTLMRKYNWTWALQQNLRFPTSRNQSAFEYIQLSRDEGQVDFGLTNLLDFQTGRWIFGTKAAYVVQAPDKVTIHVPEGNGNTEPKVTRDLGDWYSLGVDGEYRWSRRWSFSSGYSFLHKARDQYSGSYNIYASQTEQELHLSRVGVDFLLDSWGIRQGIEEKWQLSFNHYTPIAGRNSVDGSRAALELIGYF